MDDQPAHDRVKPPSTPGRAPDHWDGPPEDLIDISEIKTADDLFSSLLQIRVALFMVGGLLVSVLSQSAVAFTLASVLTVLALIHAAFVQRMPVMIPERSLRWIEFTALLAAMTHVVGGLYLWVVPGPMFQTLSMLLLAASMLNTFVARVGIPSLARVEIVMVGLALVARIVWDIVTGAALDEMLVFASVAALTYGFYVLICLKFARVRVALREAQAIQAENAKLTAVGRLTGGVAHDFNNMLTAVLGNLELARIAKSHDDCIACITLAENSARQGAMLTRELLALSGRSHFRIARSTLDALIDEAERAVDPPLGALHTLERDIELDTPVLEIDRDLMATALAKVIGNARDAMVEGGSIRVVAYRSMALRRPSVTVAVVDTGRGIAPDLRPLVFEPYFTTKPVGQGSGLGLPIARGVIEQLGGRIDIETPASGRGTEIQMHLPVMAAQRDSGSMTGADTLSI